MVKQKDPIQYFYPYKSFSFVNRSAFKRFIELLVKKEGYQLDELRFIFCSDQELLKINKQYLQHHYFTDIITFPLSEKGAPLNGEMYISIDRIKQNAKTLKVSFCEELHRVMIHGVLHLCGYKDKSSQEIKKMREREDHYLRLYFRR